MNAEDFNFLHPIQLENGRGTEGQSHKRNPPLTRSQQLRFSREDGATLMRIVKETMQINSHNQLFELLQKKDLQQLIPHNVFVSAWGKIDGLPLNVDIASAIPGIRTANVSQCRLLRMLIEDLYEKWVAHGRQPLMLGSPSEVTLKYTECDCAMHRFLQGHLPISP